jgi:anti-sigma factor RsiW
MRDAMTMDERTRILMMGYVDGRLAADEKKELLKQCREDPDLARELAKYRKLAAISDAMKFLEPADVEVRRLMSHRGYRIVRGAAAVVAVLGFAVAAASIVLDFFGGAPDGLFAGGGIAMLVGVLLFGIAETWARRRLLALDGYSEVQR